MANHFFSTNRGKNGSKLDQVAYATSSTTGDDIELRIADAAGLTKKDVHIALELFEKALYGPLGTTFPKL